MDQQPNEQTDKQTNTKLSPCVREFSFSDGRLWQEERDVARGKSVRSWFDGSSDRSFMVNPLSYFSFQPVFHDWCNKGRAMCYPVTLAANRVSSPVI